MKSIIALSMAAAILLMAVASCVAQVTLKVDNVPLPDLLRQLLTGKNYVLSPDLPPTGVTAHLDGVTVDEALQEILKAVPDVTYKKENDTFFFSRKSPAPAGAGQIPGPVRPGPGPDRSGNVRTEVVHLVFIDAADALRILRTLPSVRQFESITSGKRTIIVTGTDEAISNFKDALHLVDNESAYARSVAISVNAEFTVTEKGARPRKYVARTFTSGLEGAKLPLNLNAKAGKSSHIDLVMNVTPTVRPWGFISLVGSGSLRAHLPLDLNRSVSVATQVEPGQTATLASGSVQLPGGTVQFAITAVPTLSRFESGNWSPEAAQKKKLAPPYHQPLTAYKVPVGTQDDEPFFNEEWSWSDNWENAKESVRVSREGAKLFLPVLPGTKYNMTVGIRTRAGAVLHPASGIYLGDNKVLGITKVGTYTVSGTIPPQKASRLELTFECNDPRGDALPVALRSLSLAVVGHSVAGWKQSAPKPKSTKPAIVAKPAPASSKPALSSQAKQLPPDSQPLTTYKVLIGAPGDELYIRNWNTPEESIFWGNVAVPMRWSQSGSELVLPMKLDTEYRFSLDAHVPNAALREESGVYLGDLRIVRIDRLGNIVFTGSIPPRKTSPVVLSVKGVNWKPTDFMGTEWHDKRELGVAVRSVSMAEVK